MLILLLYFENHRTVIVHVNLYSTHSWKRLAIKLTPSNLPTPIRFEHNTKSMIWYIKPLRNSHSMRFKHVVISVYQSYVVFASAFVQKLITRLKNVRGFVIS